MKLFWCVTSVKLIDSWWTVSHSCPHPLSLSTHFSPNALSYTPVPHIKRTHHHGCTAVRPWCLQFRGTWGLAAYELCWVLGSESVSHILITANMDSALGLFCSAHLPWDYKDLCKPKDEVTGTGICVQVGTVDKGRLLLHAVWKHKSY